MSAKFTVKPIRLVPLSPLTKSKGVPENYSTPSLARSEYGPWTHRVFVISSWSPLFNLLHQTCFSAPSTHLWRVHGSESRLTRISAPVLRFCPLMVTSVPPAIGPMVGLRPSNTGSWQPKSWRQLISEILLFCYLQGSWNIVRLLPGLHQATPASKVRTKDWLILCSLSLSLSGSFTPCRHLRSSSGREHTIV